MSIAASNTDAPSIARGLAALVLAAAASLAALAGPAAHAATPQRASVLLDRSFFDASGNGVGELKDLVIDMQENRVAFAVLSVGGFLGIGDRLVAWKLPSKDLRMEGDRLVLAATKEQLRAMEGFRSSEWPEFNSEKSDYAAVGAASRFRRASDLLKADLRDRRGNDVGDVADMLVSLEEGKLLNLVVEFDPSWHEMGTLVALPMASVGSKGADFFAKFEAKDIRPVDPKAQAARKEAEERARAARASLDREERVSRFIGRDVVDPEGKSVGEVKDLLLDTRDKQVTHLVLSVGGFLGVGDRLVAYPMPAKEASFTDDGKLVLHTDKERLMAMRGFQGDRYPEMKRGGRQVVRASKVLDAEIVDYQGKDVGDVEDLVVNLASAKVHYMVAEFDPSWVLPGKLLAVPMREAKAADDGKLSMQFSLNELHRAYVFDKGKWPDVNDRGFRRTIDSYVSARR